MNTMTEILIVLTSYLIGAIPFGLIFGKLLSGIDVRTVGSGNIGATNVLRAGGKRAAIITLLSDCLKGFLPVLVVQAILHNEDLSLITGAATILGHNFPIYLGFKGGKGVATSFGTILAVSPLLGLFCLAAWLISAFVWRYSSLAALVSCGLYPILIFTTRGDSRSLGLFSLFLFGMIYYRHRENIKRLINHTEPKIGKI